MGMIRSMTGYGRGQGRAEGFAFSVEIRTVNHRFCEIAVRMPREFLFAEEAIKRAVQRHIARGRVDVYVSVTMDGNAPRTVTVDWGLLHGYCAAVDAVREALAIDEGLTLRDVLTLPGVFVVGESALDGERVLPALLAAVDEAARAVRAMREAEGAQLAADLERRVARVEARIDAIAQRAPKAVEAYRRRLENRMRELLVDVAVDEGRFLTEVALYAERTSVAEELTRLRSHCRQFREWMTRDEPIGRQLDFLVQEMNREINTIGAKANDLEISQLVVDVKSELEKIREQVQNIE